MLPWPESKSQNASRSVQPFFAQLTTDRRRSCPGMPFSLKIATAHGQDLDPVVPWVHPSSNGISIGTAVFAQLIAECSYTLQWAAPSHENCPFPWGIWIPSNAWFFGPIRAHKPNGISIGSAVLYSSPQSVPILYNGPLKIGPFPWGDLDPPSNTWFPGPTRVLNPNGISIGSGSFAELTTVTDRPTDGLRYSVCNNRPHLRRWCGLTSIAGYEFLPVLKASRMRIVLSQVHYAEQQGKERRQNNLNIHL